MANGLLRMDNIGIVVESIESAVVFFTELGMTLQGRAIVEGEWAGRVTGLKDQVVEIAMLSTPDGNCKVELSKFINPSIESTHLNAPINALGYLRMMFQINFIEEVVERLLNIGAEMVGEIVNYENTYRLCYIRSAEGILIGLAEPLNQRID